jgi:hypothetical protein
VVQPQLSDHTLTSSTAQPCLGTATNEDGKPTAQHQHSKRICSAINEKENIGCSMQAPKVDAGSRIRDGQSLSVQAQTAHQVTVFLVALAVRKAGAPVLSNRTERKTRQSSGRSNPGVMLHQQGHASPKAWQGEPANTPPAATAALTRIVAVRRTM